MEDFPLGSTAVIKETEEAVEVVGHKKKEGTVIVKQEDGSIEICETDEIENIFDWLGTQDF